MMATPVISRWWDGQPGERFWVEITDRGDLGVDLVAPQLNEQGERYWSYDMVREVSEGDVVLHYRTRPDRAFTHWSRAVGQPYEDELRWGAHGFASGRGPVEPYNRPAWRRPLDGPYSLDRTVTMEDLQRSAREIQRVYEELRADHRGPIYFPLQLSDRRPLRAFQGYMTKMPRALLDVVPEFQPFLNLADTTQPRPERPSPRAAAPGLGTVYREQDESVLTAEQDPHFADPNLIDRALRSHARIQNALADAVRAAGLEPRSTAPGEPSFDLAWEDGERLCVAEIKSLRHTNEEKQLRLAIGQILRYGHLLSAKGRPIRRIIAVERQPRDDTWYELCESVGIELVTPADFAGVVGANWVGASQRHGRSVSTADGP